MSQDLRTLIEKKFEFDHGRESKAAVERAKRHLDADDFVRGAYWQHVQMKHEILPVLLECVEALKSSIVVEDECEECGTFKAVRYEITEIKKALASITKWAESK